MYELVNTSLPNGLIPGTHGFATVAMTKGMPDTLRSRLETYCAYSHRTAVHDATYFKENPVNWFHVVLPQGEHVVGRVAPADFDYTGRTNRLARLLVFSNGEMPAIGGASILQKEARRFSEPWSGEARWLEPDKLTPGRLRLGIPPENTHAPAWRAMFGEAAGLYFARGFARLLAKNMSSGGRTIYFKTSTRHDADGTKLLALFVDLINLLPVVDRLKVSFATYPVSLPQGTICHLRGVYDRDRIFDAAAVTQPWVDCENGVVHNASLLPPEETRKVITSVKTSPSPEVLPQRPRRSNETKYRSVQDLIPPVKDSTKTLFRWIVSVALVMIISMIGVGVWLVEKAKSSGSNIVQGPEQVANNKEPPPKSPQEEENRKQKAEGQKEKAGTQATKEKEPRQKTEADAKAAEAKRKQVVADAANPAAEAERKQAAAAAERAAAEEEARKRDFAFAEANDVFLLEGGIVAKFTENQKRMTNGSLRVYWYDKNVVLTNAPAGFSPPKNRTVKNASWRFDPEPKKLVNETPGMFLIWLDVVAKKDYWDWAPLVEKMEYKAWFAKTNEIDLVELCFGKEEKVRTTWKKFAGNTLSLMIELQGKKDAMPFNCEVDPSSKRRLLSVEEVVRHIRKKEKGKTDSELKSFADEILKLQEEKENVGKAQKNYEALTNRLNKINEELAHLNKGPKKQTLGNDVEKDKKREKHEVMEKIEKIWNDLNKEEKSFYGFVLKYDKPTITGWKEQLAKRDEVIANKENELKKKKKEVARTESKIREDIKTIKFCIRKVEGGGK